MSKSGTSSAGDAASPQQDAGRTAAEDAASLAAHEIRSHLTVLNGYLSMLDDGSLGRLPEPARAVLPPMRAKTRAIMRMVEDMLEDARQQDGRLHLARRQLDLRSIVQGVADEVTFDLPATHQLLVEVPEKAVPVYADAKRVATIVRNLLDNAIKYSPEGGPVQCRVEAADGEARITVRDRGIGVDPGDVEQLFQRFERGPQDKSDVEGVGLGLYISRTVARLHGGDITMIGRRGEGAELTVRLPMSRQPPANGPQGARRS